MKKTTINLLNSQSSQRTALSSVARIFSFVSSVIVATVYVVYVASGANTTIGNNISTSGNLTIGGTAQFSGILNASSTLQVTGNTTLYGTLTLSGTSGTTTIASGQGFTVGGGALTVIGSTGAVGIGTTTPQTQLHITNSETGSNALFALFGYNGSTAQSGVRFKDETSGLELAAIKWNPASNRFDFYVGSSGNTNDIKLQVTNTGITASGTLSVTGIATSTFANGIQLSAGCFRDASGSCIGSGGGSGTVGSATLAGQVPFYATASDTLTATSTLFVSTASKVGIGTTTPNEALTVKGSIENLATSGVNPVLKGSAMTGNEPDSVYVSGKYAYVANSNSGTLQIFDVSTSSPALVGTTNTVAVFQTVHVSGRYAYVTLGTSSDSLRIYDVSNPSFPTLMGSVSINSAPQFVQVSGKYAYVVATGSDSLKIVDISNPVLPVIVGSVSTGLTPQELYVSGRYVYVTNAGSNNFQVFDVSDAAKPFLVGTRSTGSSPQAIYVSGRYAYVTATGSDTLEIYDISNPSSPTLLGSVNVGGNPDSIHVSGRYAYITNSDLLTLEVYDISNPISPFRVGSVSAGSNPYDLHVAGRFAYVTDASENILRVFDIGGLETTSAIAHSLEAGNLQVRNNILAQGQLQINGGVTIGSGGLLSSGSLAISATTTQSSILGGLFVGSTTPETTSPNYSQFASSVMVVEATSSSAVPLTIRGAGTQTGNYFQIQNSANTNQLVFNSSGNLGIGTTSPSQLLSVHGNALFSGNISSVANITATGTLNVSGLTTLGNASTTVLSASESTYLATGGGRVGIGTTNPQAALHVQSSDMRLQYSVGGNTPTRFYIFNNNSNSVTYGIAGNGSPGVTGVSADEAFVELSNSPKWHLVDADNFISRFTFIKTSGNVGIGQTSPASKLSVAGGGTFGSGYSTTAAPSNGLLVEGNVGIGTTTPSQLLSVHGNALFSGNISSVANVTATGTLTLTGTTGTSTIASGQGFTIGSSQFVVQQGSGKVGVGTTSPLGKLTVSADAGTTGLFVGTGGGADAIAVVPFAGGSGAAVQATNETGASFAPVALRGTTVTLSNGATAALTVATGGNVGIGTTNPLAKLHIATTSNTTVGQSRNLILEDTSVVLGNVTEIGFGVRSASNYQPVTIGSVTTAISGQSNADFYISTRSGTGDTLPTERVRVTNGGNVGIGTTTPSHTLAVNGLAQFAAGTAGGTASSDTAGTFKFIDWGTDQTSASSILTVLREDVLTQGGGALFEVRSGSPVWANATSLFTVKDGGNVGIGTTSPGTLLSLHSGSDFVNFGVTSTSTFSKGINIQGGCFAINGTCIGSGGGAGTVNSGTQGQVAFYDATGTAVSGTSTVFISTGSRVGIGTTTPGNKLVVLPAASDDGIVVREADGGADAAKISANSARGLFELWNAGTLTTQISGGADDIFFNGGGNFGIGTSTPAKKLSVHGDALISGNLNVSGIIATSTLTIGSATNAALDTWQTQRSLLGARYIHSSVAVGGYIYVIGGNGGSATTSIQYAQVYSDGTLGQWQENPNRLPQARYSHGSVSYNGYVYTIGGNSGSGNQSTVYYAKINSDGTIGAWGSTTALPAARSDGFVTVVANGYMYVIGGWSGSVESTVYYAKINTDGTVGTWRTNANALPAGRFRAAGAAANGYVYVIGGKNGASTFTTVYYGKLNSDGSVGAWQTNVNSLPATRDYHTVAVNNGYIYVLGGFLNNESVRTNTVAYAKLNADGSTGAWQNDINTIPVSQYGHSTVIYNGYVYVLGGETGTLSSGVYSSSFARNKIFGNLDLLGFASTTLADVNSSDRGTVGGSLFAGDIFSHGRLEITGNSMLWNGLGVSGSLTLSAATSTGDQASPVFSILSYATSTTATPVFSVAASGSTTLSQLTINNNFDAGSTTPQINTLYKENIVKGWVAFSSAPATPVIRDAFNVSSLTDNGTGDITVNWLIPFGTANYAAIVGSGHPGLDNTNTVSYLGTAKTTSSLRTNQTQASAAVDLQEVSVIAIGDQ